MFFIYLLVIIFCSSIVHYPILKKSISEDDGNWYYISVFRKFKIYNSIVQHNEMYKGSSFFNLQSIFQFIYFVFNKEDSNFSVKIKYHWYILTNLAIYFTSFILWKNVNLSLLTAVIICL